MGDAGIRRATVADASSVQDLVERAYARYVPRMHRRPAPMDRNYGEVLEQTDSWIVEIDGEVVGVIVTSSHPDHLLVENVAVLPEAQGLGIGGQLLALAENSAASSGLPEVRLYTNEVMTENLAFYPRRGYLETGRAESNGFRRVFFTKNVSTDQ